MSQHDMNVLGGNGAAVRSDINNALVALVTRNSGLTEPATTFAEMEWADTTTGLLKKRSSDNLSWIVVGRLESAYLGLLSASLFYKTDALSPVFLKTGSGNLSIKAGSSVMVNGIKVDFLTNTAVTMPALTGGTDYAIYVCDDGTIRADSNFTNPTGYTTVNSRMIGGFHYGLVAPGTTVAGGSFATTGNGKIWTQGDVDKIAGINQYSIWDLKWRSASTDMRAQKGHSYSAKANIWVPIYFPSTDTDTNGLSKAGTNICSGTVLPKIPAAFGGNGTQAYPSLNYFVAQEIASAYGCRLPTEAEFRAFAFGVTENQSVDAVSATYPVTGRSPGFTSEIGIEQATGHEWIWGEDSNFYSEAANPPGIWKPVSGYTGATGSERGQIYTFGNYGLVRVLLGGARTNASNSGSGAASWSYYPWFGGVWSISFRCVSDHLRLD